MKLKSIKVSALNQYIKNYLKGNSIFNNLRVEGEISNLRISKTGYTYFTLCDESSCISCICFYRENDAMDGDKVIVSGELSVYEARGTYELIVSSIENIGLGRQLIDFEVMRQKLKAEGKFENHRQVKLYLDRIGVITSRSGAALRDVLKTFESTGGSFEAIIYDVLVQGATSAADIKAGIDYFNNSCPVDAIMIVRGGGSAEDLAAFNNTVIVDTIYNSAVPVVTGIGHETDRTLADYAADVYCHTPTAAAEYIIRGYREIYERLKALKQQIESRLELNLRYKKADVFSWRHLMKGALPIEKIYMEKADLDSMIKIIRTALRTKLDAVTKQIRLYERIIAENNPLTDLKEGYAAVAGADGMPVTSQDKISSGDKIKMYFKEFEAEARVLSVSQTKRCEDDR